MSHCRWCPLYDLFDRLVAWVVVRFCRATRPDRRRF